MAEKERIIQEYVPGKQMTIAHLIAHPDLEVYEKLGIVDFNDCAIGLATVTPCEAAIIAVDIATKSAEVEIGFLDRFSGSLAIVGSYSSVKFGLEAMRSVLKNDMGFDTVELSIS
ncbi:BMC domain-containing protein [Streptococcus ratti]|uniref:Ethanolamine utilization protein eutS n=1 Tax=Streptococcus ratti FA-1 = DSM 20564 TaxID=699248 RepID=A0ABP2QXW5_STRRT|nr:BMC domain-containing protein [Streptococcus ratti]EJN93717.1 ethanolamine utilization protein eutS [Streptococcus ratti FA-1 = DSM 20564]EMP70610.1 ethanolamine utilization protein eutS [Streptococcus ratti FA-1 = DSM 20564]QEY07572.1 BMC domain-containing protein [Streptococcus ratti]VEI60029.1 propanediol utilization protein PduU [Streptococcus mutans]